MGGGATGTAGEVAGPVEGRPTCCWGPWVWSGFVLNRCLVFSDILSSVIQILFYYFITFGHNYLGGVFFASFYLFF